ncbi:MAG: hypothetical protein M0R23_08920, partial [Bacteroidales bacterium]|nr:hypothetical protein [Bacteroidales bacterium]
MARQLSSMITNQITSQDIKGSFLFYVGGNHYNSYLLNWEISYDTSFGAAQATFTLNNNDGEFGEGKSRTINIGDVVEFIELYQGDSTQFKKFYGIVEQRAISKQSGQRTISLSCLDYIGVLSKWDIDMVIEGTRVEVVEEKLEPVYLDAPNDGMAQLFNFANNGIATKPLPLIKVRDINHTDNVEAQYDGFEIYYE